MLLDQSLLPFEPIHIPKLRIEFADFPYLHYSNQLEAIHLRDLMRLSVRPLITVFSFDIIHFDFQGLLNIL